MYPQVLLLLASAVSLIPLSHAQIAQPKNPIACTINGTRLESNRGSGTVWPSKPFLHAWVGSYYNGTVTFSSSFSSANCTAQESPQTLKSLPAVLSIISPKYYQGLGRKDEFIYLLSAWDKDADLAAKERVRGMPLDTRVDIKSVPGFSVGSILSNTLTACALETETDGKEIKWECDYKYDRNVSFNRPGEAVTEDNSYVRVSDAPTCRGGDGKAELVVVNFENMTAALSSSSSWESPKAAGKFSTEQAEFELKGPFISGFFEDWDEMPADDRYDALYSLAGRKGIAGAGKFELKFSGKIDEANSHKLAIREDGEVEWTEDREKTRVMQERLTHPCFKQDADAEEEGGSEDGGSEDGGGSREDAATSVRVGGLITYVVAIGLLAMVL